MSAKYNVAISCIIILDVDVNFLHMFLFDLLLLLRWCILIYVIVCLVFLLFFFLFFCVTSDIKAFKHAIK